MTDHGHQAAFHEAATRCLGRDRAGCEAAPKRLPRGHRCGIAEKLLDAIVGHAPASVGRAYGEPTLADKAKALEQFPRGTSALGKSNALGFRPREGRSGQRLPLH